MLTEKRGHRGYSLMELLLVLSILGILATFAVPRLLSTRSRASEGVAVTVVRGIVTSQATYSLTAGFGKYALNLTELYDAGMIDAVVATGTKEGYIFSVGGDGMTFTINADPVTYGSTASRSFFSDPSAVIRFTTEDRPAAAGDEPIQ